MKNITIITIIAFYSIFNSQAFGDESVIISDSKKHYEIYHAKTDLSSGHYESRVYLPLKKFIKGILILTPTIAGVSVIEKSNAQYFSKAGFLVIIPLPFESEITSERPDIKKLDEEFFKPAYAAERFIIMVEQKFNLPSNLPVFAMGASQGGIRTLTIASYVKRITASWFATAGGDFPSIYANSSVEKIADFRIKHMRVLGITENSVYEQYLRDNLVNDPTTACAQIKTPFVQTMTLRDDKVPTANQKLLVDYCPKHTVITLNTGHVAGSLSTVKWRHKIKVFFESHL